MKIYIGADHNGFYLKADLKRWLETAGYQVVDEGDNRLQADDDFPQFAARVVSAILTSDEPQDLGVLICGSGQGMCMAANRFPGIRASLCWDTNEAKMSRNDDNANVLCLPARVLSDGTAENILRVWMSTPFAGATRFKRRLKQLDELP